MSTINFCLKILRTHWKVKIKPKFGSVSWKNLWTQCQLVKIEIQPIRSFKTRFFTLSPEQSGVGHHCPPNPFSVQLYIRLFNLNLHQNNFEFDFFRKMKSSKDKEDFPTQVGQKRFAQWKKTALSKADLSRKGSIDEPLVEWVNLGMFKIILALERSLGYHLVAFESGYS